MAYQRIYWETIAQFLLSASVTCSQVGKTQQQEKQDKNHWENGDYSDTSKATRLTIQRSTFIHLNSSQASKHKSLNKT